MIYNTGASIIRAVGDSKRPLYFLIASCLLNIVLDLLLVCVLHLDIVGVAVGTVIAQLVSCFITTYTLSYTRRDRLSTNTFLSLGA